MNYSIRKLITTITFIFIILFTIPSYATEGTPPPLPETNNRDKRLIIVPSPSFRHSPSLRQLSRVDTIPSITVTSCERETRQLIPSHKKTHSSVARNAPPTVVHSSPRHAPLLPPPIEDTSSPLSTLCLHENCLDDPYEDIFLPCLPPQALSRSARDDVLPSQQLQPSVNSMIEVAYGLFTTYFLIDGSKTVAHGYSLPDDLRCIFEHYQTRIHVKGDIYKPLSSTPSIRVKNLSAGDMNLLLSTLNNVLISPFNENSIDALYLKNVEIDEECGYKLQLLLSQNDDLQNLWLEDCKIDDQAFHLLMQGVDKSHLRSFWLLDDETDFRLPPAL